MQRCQKLFVPPSKGGGREFFMKTQKNLQILCFIFLLCFGVLCSTKTCYADDTDPDENPTAMTVTFSDGNRSFTAQLLCNGCFFTWANPWVACEELSFLKDTVQIEVNVLMPEVIDMNTLQYETTLYRQGEHYLGNISFMFYDSFHDYMSYEVPYPTIYTPDISVAYIETTCPAKGFHPSKGNQLSIYSEILDPDLRNNYYNGVFYIRDSLLFRNRLRILDSNGKCVHKVYEKDMTTITSDSKTSNSEAYKKLLSYTWDGKADKNNEAGLTFGAYVPDGDYTIEITHYYSNGKTKPFYTTSATKNITISRNAPGGTKGLKAAKKIKFYTGDATCDYLAEDMLKKAGVKANMSDDKKVKKIYTYMVKNFKHTDNYDSIKLKYNLKKLKSKIKAYGDKTQKLFDSHQVMHNYITNDFMLGFLQDCLARRGGVCTENALMFKIMCQHEGIPCYLCDGYYLNQNGTTRGHSWNKAIINGKSYYFDVDVEIQNYKKGHKSFYWYKKTYEQSTKNHKYSAQNL